MHLARVVTKMNEAAQTGSLLSFDRKTISEILGETGEYQRDGRQAGRRTADRERSRPRRRSLQTSSLPDLPLFFSLIS